MKVIIVLESGWTGFIKVESPTDQRYKGQHAKYNHGKKKKITKNK